MMKKIQMNTTEAMKETFERFIIATRAKGTVDKTMKAYREQYSAIPFVNAVHSRTPANKIGGRRVIATHVFLFPPCGPPPIFKYTKVEYSCKGG